MTSAGVPPRRRLPPCRCRPRAGRSGRDAGRQTGGRRAGSVAVAVLVLTLQGGVLPAAAHGPPSDAPYYLCRVSAVAPRVDGVSVDVARDGSWVRVRNTTATELVILGYDGEPYLRVGPAGTEENVAAVSSLVNGDFGSGLVTRDAPDSQVARAPHWESRSLEPVATWHDVRTHYDGTRRPPVVQDDPGAPHHLATWHLHGVYGARQLSITGTLDWTGKPGLFAGRSSQLLWGTAGLAAITCGVLVASTARTRRRSQGSPDGSARR